MTLDTSFTFSQSVLQDFLDCRRRFQLRYLQRLAWPAVESQPVLENERYRRQGERFHLMLQQRLSGVPLERLEAMAGEADLSRWWGHYLAHEDQVVLPGAARYPEITLAAPLAGYRLVAKLDLLLRLPADSLQPATLVRIVDWKTARKRPARANLAQRIQTRLYPYLAVRAGAHLNGGAPLQPAQVEMWYWYAETPDQPERFTYSERAFLDDQAYLSSLIETIQRLEESDYPMTTDERRCAFCVYRSLCARGQAAGRLDEAGELDLDELPGAGLDFDQIAEIAF